MEVSGQPLAARLELLMPMAVVLVCFGIYSFKIEYQTKDQKLVIRRVKWIYCSLFVLAFFEVAVEKDVLLKLGIKHHMQSINQPAKIQP